MLRLTLLLLAIGTVAWAPVRTSVVERGNAVEAARPLPFSHDLYTFRGTGGRTTVVGAFAVEASALDRRSFEGVSRYRFDVSLIVADTVSLKVYRSDDSVFVAAPSKLSGQHLLHTFTEVQVPPSRTTLQRVVMTDANTPGVGQLYTEEFRVPDYRGEELMISDIAFGIQGSAGGWSRGGKTLALLPTSQFPESAFDLYYELYNLEEDGRHETQVTITALGEEGEETDESPVRARFTERSNPDARGTSRVLRSIQSALSEGRYRLTITVTDRVSGRRATRIREFQVRDGLTGTTLVPALPWRVGRGGG